MANVACLPRLEPLRTPISIIAIISSEIILRSLGLKLLHFSLSFFEETFIDSFPSDAIDEAFEEADF